MELQEIVDRGLAIADLQDSEFIDGYQQLDATNWALSELYDLMVGAFEDWFLATETYTDGYAAYDLPSDFYKVRRLFGTEDGKRVLVKRRSLEEIDVEEPGYFIAGSRLHVMEPAELGNIELWYIPAYELATDLSDTISFHIPPGWEEYAVISVAIRFLTKEESDTQHLEAERTRLEARIRNAAAERDTSEPRTIRKTYKCGKNL